MSSTSSSFCDKSGNGSMLPESSSSVVDQKKKEGSALSCSCDKGDNRSMPESSSSVVNQKKEEGLLVPNDGDVLMGRGKSINYHPGNVQFRQMVACRKVAYVTCPKHKKPDFAQEIVSDLSACGVRFLKQDERNRKWYVVDHKQALSKTRQALREGAPVLCEKVILNREIKDPHDRAQKKRKCDQDKDDDDAQQCMPTVPTSDEHLGTSSLIQELLRKRSKIQPAPGTTTPSEGSLCLSSPISPLVRQLQIARRPTKTVPSAKKLSNLRSGFKTTLEPQKQVAQEAPILKQQIHEQKLQNIQQEVKESLQQQARVEALEAGAQATVASLGSMNGNIIGSSCQPSSAPPPAPHIPPIMMWDPMSFWLCGGRQPFTSHLLHPAYAAQQQELISSLTQQPHLVVSRSVGSGYQQNQDLLLLALLKNATPHLSYY